METFACEAEHVGDEGAVLTVAGEVDLHTAGALRDTLDDLGRQGLTKRLVVDLTHVTFIDSTALGVLVKAQKDSHGPLHVVTNKDIFRILQMTGLDRLFVLHPTREKALEDLIR